MARREDVLALVRRLRARGGDDAEELVTAFIRGPVSR